MAALLTQGQTGELGVADVTVTVHFSAGIDLAALLLTDHGTVRDNGDLIFYNQPSGPGVQLVPGQNAVAVSLRAIPQGVAHIRIVIALDERDGRLGDYPAPHIAIDDEHGNALYEYVIENLGNVTTVAAVDLDRGDDGWYARAVGFGHPRGFAALLSDHGVAVSNSSPPARTPASPTIAPVLRAGDTVALRRQGADLSFVKMGLGWDPVHVQHKWGSRPVEIDLDASALVYAGNDLIDAAYYGQLVTKDGAIRHSGDNLTGEGKGDDEVITVDLTRIGPHVTAIVFVITSYAGHTFERVRNAFWRLIDGTTSSELTRSNLSAGGPHTGMVVAKVHREDGIWKVQALGHPIQAGHPVEAAAQVGEFL
ncbi:stress protein [Nocardia yunnanensis]|uniref:Stress protein n=1 Tax=Nocardia yunnanensis TaxID=2382165 RepID=A0A386Z999_9NOCA|nr:TerD family protein [Nocardia yunnanensis]AYF74231.1 stress protein [Nocardia yunnanensis]